MAKIPEAVRETSLFKLLSSVLKLLNQGKVRDTFEIPGWPDLLLVVATDRVSVFDVILPALVYQKGEELNAMNIFWRLSVLKGIPHDLVAYGLRIDEYLPTELRGNIELQKRAVIVKKLQMSPVELVERGYLTGSGWKAYKDNNCLVCGHRLPSGLTDGSELVESISTPTTKAEIGHDEHVDFRTVDFKLLNLGKEVYQQGAEYAHSRGIIIADDKCEAGIDPKTGELTLGDEVLTPDSSRFWSVTEWGKAQKEGKSPKSHDKQFVRNWCLENIKLNSVPIDKLDTENPEHVAFVHSCVINEEVLRMTRFIYRCIFWKLTGKKLEVFQREVMGVNVPDKKLKVEIIIGSESDESQIKKGFEVLHGKSEFRVSVMSCHRNPEELRKHVSENLVNADRVIAGAGKAAQLPGVVKALLCECGRPYIPVIGVAFEGKNSLSNQAATLSIEELPGQPVEMDEEAEAYFGPQGFIEACEAALGDEFFPKSFSKKPAKIGEWQS